MKNFKDAINEKVLKLGAHKLSYKQQLEYTYVEDILRNMKAYKSYNKKSFADHFPNKLLDICFNGEWCSSKYHGNFQVTGHYFDAYGRLWFKLTEMSQLAKIECTCAYLASEYKFETDKLNEYIAPLDYLAYNKKIRMLETIKRLYNLELQTLERDASRRISRELNSKKDTSIVSRESIIKAVKKVKTEKEKITNNLLVGLSSSELKTLISYLLNHMVSLRFYVLKDSKWDKALKEVYPDSVYAQIHKTIPAENSSKNPKGYIAVDSIEDAPLDIIKKITRKGLGNFIKGKHQYVLNNTYLVLFLLQQYGGIFKLGRVKK